MPGYGQASYELPYGFKLIAGFRTSYEQRKLTAQTNFATDWLDPAVRAGLGLAAARCFEELDHYQTESHASMGKSGSVAVCELFDGVQGRFL